MAAFVRFIFTILAVGAAVNLIVVVLANSRSQQQRSAQYAYHAQQYGVLLEDSNHTRRADIVVEQQRMDARNNAIETTLLMRQYYRSYGTAQTNSLPPVRIVIPGDKLQVGGVTLNFGGQFQSPEDEYRLVRGHQIGLFTMVCGAGELAPISPTAEDPRFTYFPRDRVPELLRLSPLSRQPFYYELKLWQYVWSVIPEMPKGATLPWGVRLENRLDVQWTKPATITVRRGHTYTAYVSPDGEVSLSEDEPGMPNLLEIMLQEGRRLDEEADE